jgi:hypothetical protein
MSPGSVHKHVAAGALRAMRATPLQGKNTGSAKLIIPRSEVLRWMIEHPAR